MRPPKQRPIEHERAVWSTTSAARFDEIAAAHDDASTLGVHAATCRRANRRLGNVVDVIREVRGILQPRLITLLMGILLATGTAAWVFV